MPDKDKNLYQRISSVMEDIKRLQKDKNVGSGNYAYKAMSEEKVATAVRESMIRHGLVVFPISQQHSLVDFARPGRNGEATLVSLSTVDVQYKLVNTDNPAEFEILASSGTGVDPQDKGVGKAMTYSMKYLLMRTFLIPTGNDPDDIHNEDLAREQEKAAQERTAAIQRGVAAMNAAKTQDDVKAVFTKGFMSDPDYKSAAEAAIARVKKPKPAPAEAPAPDLEPPAPFVGAAENGEYDGGMRETLEQDQAFAEGLASPVQKEEFIRLLNHPKIHRSEKTRGLLAINKMSPEQADEATAKLRKTIQEREEAA